MAGLIWLYIMLNGNSPTHKHTKDIRTAAHFVSATTRVLYCVAKHVQIQTYIKMYHVYQRIFDIQRTHVRLIHPNFKDLFGPHCPKVLHWSQHAVVI